jgi:tetratricopeptide (TPR) repeat protein
LQLEQARREEPTNAETDYLTGVIYQRWQQPQKAADAYAAAAAKNPGELCYVLAQAEMLVALNRPAEALSLLQTKAGSFEHSGAIRDEIGQLLLQQRRFGEAVSSLREACMLCSDDTTFAEHLAFALLADHQYVEACDRLDRLSKEPGYDKRADLLAALGECQSQTGQLAMAKQSFTTATQLNPACAGYWLGLAKVSIQLDDLPAAEADIRRATAADPKSSDAQCLLGYLRLKQNQLPESLAAFRAAADLDSSDSTNLSLQGYVLTRMGRKIDALTVCERALKINPRDDLAKQLIPPCDQHD